MNQKSMILVTGATGAQGGSVVRALLNENKFAIRCLTRNAASEKALALKALGAEIVEGSMDDVESLTAAMQGCYGVFGVTNFWEHFENEYIHGKNLVDAVNRSGIQHFVFSTLPHYHKLSNGVLSVPHCDLKAALEQYARNLNLPATFVHVAFYYENFLDFFPPQLGADGVYHFGFPQGDTKLAMVSVEDVGGVVVAIFNHPQEYIGRRVGIVGEDRTCAEYAATMSRILNHTISYRHIPRETYAAYGFPGAEELANMFDVQRQYIPERLLHLIESYGLNPAMHTFESWLKKHAHLFNMPPVAAETVVAQ
jgi:uncharacterized protein YbjT (DUF2867 family)